MEDLWRSAKHFGLGVVDFTKEKVEAFVDDMVKRGELTEQETSKAVAEIMEKAQSEQEAFLEQLKAMVGEIVSEESLARKDDLEDLAKRVAVLEKKLQQG